MTTPVSGRVVADADRRFSAWLIDRLLSLGLYAVAALVAYVALIRPGHTVLGVLLVVLAAIATWFVGAVMVGLSGVTPGRSLRGIKVVDLASGAPVGLGPALARQAVVGLGGYPTVGLGDLALAWTATVDETGLRRGWHDRVAGSVVVDIRSRPAETAEAEQPEELVNLTAMRLMPAEPASGTEPAPAMPAMQRVPARVPQAPVEREAPVDPPPVPRVTSVTSVTRPTPPAEVAPPAEAASPAEVPSSGEARWRVTFDTGESFVVEGLALVGRGPEPQPGERAAHLVVLPSANMSLSKTHAQFGIVPDGTLVVMDRGSTNGSLVLRGGVAKPLPARQPVTLRDGDRVRFGDREMSVAREV